MVVRIKVVKLWDFNSTGCYVDVGQHHRIRANFVTKKERKAMTYHSSKSFNGTSPCVLIHGEYHSIIDHRCPSKHRTEVIFRFVVRVLPWLAFTQPSMRIRTSYNKGDSYKLCICALSALQLPCTVPRFGRPLWYSMRRRQRTQYCHRGISGQGVSPGSQDVSGEEMDDLGTPIH
jgi:hypothetical protein